ncbi:hypothetical protein Fot_54034 [Forsythia ovata]|uniref:Uncharacterized protein n=1 Tax=Forsythia ovata TaxID=205694 RepID=A0ABD1PFW3_9LAMI
MGGQFQRCTISVAEHDIRAQCDWGAITYPRRVLLQSPIAPFITPGRCAPPKPSPTPDLISGERNGKGSHDARKVRKWGLKIAVKDSELEEEMGGFGGEVEAGGVSSAAVGEVTPAVGRQFRAQIGRRGK